MKKYTEIKNKRPFDWDIALSKYCQDMSIRELNSLQNRAAEWVTCACGNQCAIIPRQEDGEPVDLILRNLGQQFYTKGVFAMVINAKRNINPDYKSANAARLNAIKILKQIEKRSDILIKQEIKKSKQILIDCGYTVKK